LYLIPDTVNSFQFFGPRKKEPPTCQSVIFPLLAKTTASQFSPQRIEKPLRLLDKTFWPELSVSLHGDPAFCRPSLGGLIAVPQALSESRYHGQQHSVLLAFFGRVVNPEGKSVVTPSPGLARVCSEL
jgi:hypothetical protein